MNYSPRLRLLLLAVVIIAGFCALFYRLWYLQIDQQEFYMAQQPETDTAKQRVPGTRGNLRDRTGNYYFARNETSMEVGINLRAVETAWFEKHRLDLRKKDFVKPMRPYGPKAVEGLDIIAVLNEMVFQPLNNLKLYKVPATDAAKRKQEQSIILSYMSNKGVIPFPYEKDLLQGDEESFRRFTAYAENAPNIPGLTITERPKRRYPMKAMAGHLVGYIREERELLPEEEQKRHDLDEKEGKHWYSEADDIGVAGLEESQDEKLRGKPGERTWLVNEHGRLTEEIRELRRDPLPGADVFLTIDARKQYIAEMALRDSKAGRAAAVVLDPNTGEVLAIASIPSYDTSIFLPPKDNDAINELYDKNSPYPSASLPYALSADSPGSSFKLMIALAASMSGRQVIHPYNCSGFMNYGGKKPIKCMGTHGTIGMSEAIKRSCNCYFMQLAVGTKIENIQKMTRLFNFGGQDFEGGSGIEVPGIEANGRIRSDTGSWSQSTTALVGIGQGGATATPLQLAMLASAIGNGGKVYQPTLIHHYEEYQYDRDGRRQKIITEFKAKQLADLIKMGVKQRDLDTMREGMFRVVNEQGGSGLRGKSTMCVIAGKTSTAERKRDGKPDNRVWFMAFAPYEKPTIAVAVLVVNGKLGGRVAAPIAKRIIEQSLGVDAGTYHVKPFALEPAKGGYNHLDEVVFEGDSVPAGPDEPEAPEASGDEEPEEQPVAVVPEPKPAAPKAEVVPEDDAPVLTRQVLEPVKFRLKTDPPNPPAPPPAAKAH